MDTQKQQQKSHRSQSPKFSETIENNLFMTNVISTPKSTTLSSDYENEISFRKNLEEISKDIKEIEDFLTVSENIIHHKNPTSLTINSLQTRRGGIQKSSAFKINSYKPLKKTKISCSNLSNSKLYFRNGRIGCVEADKNISNVESTHALIKNILKYESEKPLVSPENVEKVLNEIKNGRNKKKLRRVDEIGISREIKEKDLTKIIKRKELFQDVCQPQANENKEKFMNENLNDVVLLDLPAPLMESSSITLSETPNSFILNDNNKHKLGKIEEVSVTPGSASNDQLKK